MAIGADYKFTWRQVLPWLQGNLCQHVFTDYCVHIIHTKSMCQCLQ